MIIFHYHPVTRELIGMGQADPSPLEPDRYLVPAHATTIAPPTVGENEVAVFEGGKWVIKPDYRGATYYCKNTGEKYVIEQIGEEPSDDLTDTPPPKNHRWGENGWELDEEAALFEIRQIRDALLMETDKLAIRHQEQLSLMALGLIDSPTLSDEQYEEFIAYRQALRDLPETVDVHNPVFPNKPSFLP